jgi:hypothetical protein
MCCGVWLSYAQICAECWESQGSPDVEGAILAAGEDWDF